MSLYDNYKKIMLRLEKDCDYAEGFRAGCQDITKNPHNMSSPFFNPWMDGNISATFVVTALGIGRKKYEN